MIQILLLALILGALYYVIRQLGAAEAKAPRLHARPAQKRLARAPAPRAAQPPAPAAAPPPKEALPPITAQANRTLTRGAQQVEELLRIASAVADQEVARRVGELCDTAERITDKIRQRPAALPLVQRHYDYYLQTAHRLMRQYEQFMSSPVYTKEMEFQAKRIEHALVGLQGSFLKALRKLLNDELVEVEVEVNTLEHMMRGESEPAQPMEARRMNS
ncbi:5-bromo-4-chloroindolyl phosphate hydrolysis family protein [Paenibacillus sp. IB182496]|uniref:5-bromo-4-chloroindolyl phosphate hydrolysis family protein n=1 Tax=Paenibacillus sabuli TaxID=2772509 RepID=A0A927BUN9_9BACL|nr:5-bromo-4-chloroindolyl phosphate hydrolysis family protein [Paenibacillus sabuli]MBD2845980.1 5-bromo-4-chloroindolyl phosphate hydrolysis family protein [Paenibacillus sabuli]